MATEPPEIDAEGQGPVKKSYRLPALIPITMGANAAGSYEPSDRRVVGVEPSLSMITQRGAEAGPAVRAVAEALPFSNQSFDAALATLTIHHWTDLAVGLSELRRVAVRQVVLMFEPWYSGQFWLVDYFPEWLSLPKEVNAPRIDDVRKTLDVHTVIPVPVPADCTDGFAGAYWRRPEAYLDPSVRASISGLAMLPPEVIERSVDRLQQDLASGAWETNHGYLREIAEIDLGYRLLTAG